MARVGERQLSRGHAERFDAVVWANDVARATFDAATGDLPDGAMLVEEAFERPPRDAPAGLLVMEKREGVWRFTAVGPRGEATEDAHTAATCAACHRDAPRDSVFPLVQAQVKPVPALGAPPPT
jgi:hypothetical protein